MKHMWRYVVLALMATALAAPAVVAQEVSFKDPVGDDNGPGAYSYPTDKGYQPGSFDLTSFKVKVSGGKANIEVGQNSQLEDRCWAMQYGFCVQMVFVFIKTDPNTGHTEGLPGLNVGFAPEAGRDQGTVLFPQPPSRLKHEA